MALNQDLSIFGFLHDFRTTPTASMTYTRSENCTNMVVGEPGTQTFKVVVVVLLLSGCRLMLYIVPTNAHPFSFRTSGLSKYT